MAQHARTKAVAASLLLTTAAAAHPGHAIEPAPHSLLHLFTGIDHLLVWAVLALLAARHRVWIWLALPSLFVTGFAYGSQFLPAAPSLFVIASLTALALATVACRRSASRAAALPTLGTAVAFGGAHGLAHTFGASPIAGVEPIALIWVLPAALGVIALVALTRAIKPEATAT